MESHHLHQNRGGPDSKRFAREKWFRWECRNRMFVKTFYARRSRGDGRPSLSLMNVQYLFKSERKIPGKLGENCQIKSLKLFLNVIDWWSKIEGSSRNLKPRYYEYCPSEGNWSLLRWKVVSQRNYIRRKIILKTCTKCGINHG